METNNSPKFPKFICECCNIKTNNKKDYTKHILTAKHKKLTTVNNVLTNSPNNDQNLTIFTCKNCDKEYCSRVGLWKHIKKCNIAQLTENDDEYICQGINIKDKDALVFHLLKQNGDLQNKIIEMVSQSTITNKF